MTWQNKHDLGFKEALIVSFITAFYFFIFFLLGFLNLRNKFNWTLGLSIAFLIISMSVSEYIASALRAQKNSFSFDAKRCFMASIINYSFYLYTIKI